MASPAAVRFQDVTCTFTDRHNPSQRYTAVRDVSFEIAAGEFVSVVGPTGCGRVHAFECGRWTAGAIFWSCGDFWPGYFGG